METNTYTRQTLRKGTRVRYVGGDRDLRNESGIVQRIVTHAGIGDAFMVAVRFDNGGSASVNPEEIAPSNLNGRHVRILDTHCTNDHGTVYEVNDTATGRTLATTRRSTVWSCNPDDRARGGVRWITSTDGHIANVAKTRRESVAKFLQSTDPASVGL